MTLPDDVWHLSRFVGDSHVQFGRGSFMTNMFGEGQGHPYDCREIRARAPNGQLSEPATVCVGDGPQYDLTSAGSQPIGDVTCTAQGLRWNGELVSERMRELDPGPDTSGSTDAVVVSAGDAPEADAGGCSIGGSGPRQFPLLVAAGLAALRRAGRRRRPLA